jgi:hypothetical protein
VSPSETPITFASNCSAAAAVQEESRDGGGIERISHRLHQASFIVAFQSSWHHPALQARHDPVDVLHGQIAAVHVAQVQLGTRCEAM